MSAEAGARYREREKGGRTCLVGITNPSSLTRVLPNQPLASQRTKHLKITVLIASATAHTLSVGYGNAECVATNSKEN